MKNSFLKLFTTAVLISVATLANATQITLFSEDLESGTNNWTVGGSTDSVSDDGGYFHLSQRWSSGTTNTSWYYGIESTGDCGTNDYNNGYLITPSIDLSSVTNAALTFNHLPRGESDWWIDDDQVYVDVSTDNFETYTTVLTGLLVGWEMWGDGGWPVPETSVDISQFAGQTIKVRFRVYITRLCGEHTDLSMCPITEGWYLDDVTVTGEQ